MDQEEAFHFVERSQNAVVKSVHPPSWNKCGRPKNAYVVLDSGSSFCARYRDPHNKLVLGMNTCVVVREITHVILFKKEKCFVKIING